MRPIHGYTTHILFLTLYLDVQTVSYRIKVIALSTFSEVLVIRPQIANPQVLGLIYYGKAANLSIQILNAQISTNTAQQVSHLRKVRKSII
jgi:hypothetical protein